MAAQQLGIMGPGSLSTTGLNEHLHCLIIITCLMICIPSPIDSQKNLIWMGKKTKIVYHPNLKKTHILRIFFHYGNCFQIIGKKLVENSNYNRKNYAYLLLWCLWEILRATLIQYFNNQTKINELLNTACNSSVIDMLYKIVIIIILLK